MGLLSKLSKLGVGVAMVATFLMYKPEVVLKLPNGFIPYAILGHPPPAHFMFDAWDKEELPTWMKSGDLVVAAGAKCGTNWILYMSHLIRVKGDTESFPFEDVNVNTPWPTLRHEPGQQWADLKDKMNTAVLPDGSRLKDKWDHPDFPFRIFKSHEQPDDQPGSGKAAVLPVRSRRDIKFVAAVRNPLDQLRSLYPFFANHKNEFRRMWGDFPPVYASVEEMMTDFTDGGVLGDLIWGYPAMWFKYKDDPNVLLFNYDNMLEDREGHVKMLAKFLEVELTPEELAKITHLTSFAEMKKLGSRFDYVLWGHSTRPTDKIMQEGKLLRAGKQGQGQEFFTQAQKDKVSGHIQQHFSPELQEWMGIAI